MLKWKHKNNNYKGGVATKMKATVFTSVAASLLTGHAFAQDAAKEEAVYEEEVVVVSAARKALQDALTLKREAQNISDVLASGDIGEIPSLSVAEALEAIPGATTHRLKGSGSQVSLRGLGPVLGFETFNGRAVTTGSADRSVNFQQFPSELMDKIIIHKSQTADMIEGGTSGTVELRTHRPLDYGKRAAVLDLRGKYNEHAARVEGNSGLGSRGSFTYIDQFDVGDGALGVSAGLAFFDSGNPEEQYITSSTFYICENDGETEANTARCGDNSDGFAAISQGYYETLYNRQQADSEYVLPSYYIVPNSIAARTSDEYDERIAFMGSLQWQPNDMWEVNADLQISNKIFEEERLELQIDTFRRGHRNVSINTDGTINSLDGSSTLRLDANNFERDEEYRGGGIAVKFEPNDDLTLEMDLSYSQTTRAQDQRYARFRTSEEINFSYEDNGLLPSISLLDWTSDSDLFEDTGVGYQAGDQFNPNDPASFDNDGNTSIRRRLLDRDSEISAIRFDGDYQLGDTGITSLEFGIRHSSFHRETDEDDNLETQYANLPIVDDTTTVAQVRSEAFAECSRDFRNDDFFGSGNGSLVGIEFVDFDTNCVIAYVNGGSTQPPASQAPFTFADIDVEEIVTAVYVKANFEFDVGVPVYGNIGVRGVKNTIESTGRSGDFRIVDTGNVDFPFAFESSDPTDEDDVLNGSFDEFTVENTENAILPSATAIFELSDSFLIRTAIYRSMSRHNIDFFRSSLAISGDSDDEFATAQEAIDAQTNATITTGNPELEPIFANNYDLSFEWYKNEETTVSVALYSKDFESELETVRSVSEFNVDGFGVTDFTTQLSQESGESANLWGIELNAQTVFTTLPSPFDGIGTRLTYNYSKTDFVTQDPDFGDTVFVASGTPENPEEVFIPDSNGVVSRIVDTTGETYSIPGISSAGLLNLDEASFFGQSEHSASWTVFWDVGDFNFQIINKWRSEYFQPNAAPTVASNRWIAAFHLVDLSARWKINDMVKLRATVQNIGDEPQIGHRTQQSNSLTLWSSTGPKWELGVTVKF